MPFNPLCPDDEDDYCEPCPPAPSEGLGRTLLVALLGAAATALGTWVVEEIRARYGATSNEDKPSDE